MEKIRYNKLINRIKTKLEKLKKLDKDLDIFGADDHKYVLNTVLTEAEVSAYEKKHGITLPEEYREFLLNIGNGGAGPFDGLFALEDNDDVEVAPERQFPFTFNKPFHFGSDFPEDLDDDALDAFWEDLSSKADSGVIYLTHEGCGMYSVLVVNGEERDNVWYIDMANDAGIFPLKNASGRPMGFSEWYELWLDASICELEDGVEGLGGYANFIHFDDTAAFLCHIAAVQNVKTLDTVLVYGNIDKGFAHIMRYGKKPLRFDCSMDFFIELEERCSAGQEYIFRILKQEHLLKELVYKHLDTPYEHVEKPDLFSLFGFEGVETVECDRFDFFIDDENARYIFLSGRNGWVINTTLHAEDSIASWYITDDEEFRQLINGLPDMMEDMGGKLISSTSGQYPFELLLAQNNMVNNIIEDFNDDEE